MAEYGSRGREDRLPARRTSSTPSTGSGSRFPERRGDNTPTYSVTDANPPRTEYVYLQNKGGGGGGNRILRWRPQPRNADHNLPGFPEFMRNDRVLLYAWLGAMAVVSFDEWHNHGVLPRPARLWYTTLTYLLLMGVSMVDIMIPITNALGIGFFMILIYQYYNGSGQFAKGA